MSEEKSSWFKRFSCWMGWHSWFGYEDAHHDPNDPLQFLVFAKCPWCKFEGQIDSQGNLF
jgi:hypothetical protein